VLGNKEEKILAANLTGVEEILRPFGIRIW